MRGEGGNSAAYSCYFYGDCDGDVGEFAAVGDDCADGELV